MAHTVSAPLSRRQPGAARRGAASLVVVMILFFIITLVAAYTSRNLLFEQRTSANQYRATVAFEAADAGIEWAIARLNEGRMDDTCTEVTTVASPPQPSFRERYLSIDETTGVVTALTQAGVVPPATQERLAGCVFNGTNWVCHCPESGFPNPTVTLPTTGGPYPGFWVRFRSNLIGSRPGVVRIQVNACTRFHANCLDFNREATSGDGLATVWSMVALRSSMPTAPAAALTVRGAFNGPGGGDNPTITNTDAGSGGLTIHSGSGIATAGIVLNTLPGTPPQASIAPDDPALALPNLAITPATPANDGRNRMFMSVFGLWPATYLAQPGIGVVDCAGGCNAADVNAIVARRPGQPVHVSGGGTLRINANIGTAAAPVLIIADGDVEFDSGTPSVFGVIYSRSTDWDLRGDGTIQGAAIAERAFTFADDDPAITYDLPVILRVRNRLGTFAKIAGSWRDFQPGLTP